ncbi:ImmA/IrrE family metallo-endopeptidase [Listeria booriae]|uniref:ImmA/IrrE family metallo-endopeptidase n=1 Tax=Listeria booriae TaxID=1552123 RepID=UPI001629497A|nr:ImmA/IrrE family metallo-endopeptidase [Listeria booriae]MBC1651276.1 ImmA/IrrE family metallo-endopeptidase [Listeria booriae]
MTSKMAMLEMMTTVTTYKANYAKAQKIAYEVIANSKLTDLPINLKKLIASCEDLTLMSYKRFGKINHLSRDEVIAYAQSEDGCLWYSKSDKQYVLLYNQSVLNVGRRRFTIAHELGHYFLKHNEMTDRSLLSRTQLSKLEHEVFEQEANYFAKRLLVPIPLVDLYLDQLPAISKDLIINVFDVSYTVSNYVIKDLHNRNRNGIRRTPHVMCLYFKNFVFSDTHYFTCPQCNHINYKPYDYCPICGIIEKQSHTVELDYFESRYIFTWKWGRDMIYNKIPLDEAGKALRCPKCENEELGQFEDSCPVCNTYLINTCTGVKDSGYYDADLYGEYLIADGCGKTLSGNARYCSCGALSTFYHQDVLRPWEEEKKKYDELKRLNSK